MTFSSTQPTYVFYKHIKTSLTLEKLRKTKDHQQKRKKKNIQQIFILYLLTLFWNMDTAGPVQRRVDMTTVGGR